MHSDRTVIIVADLGRLKAYRVVVTEGVDPHETMQVSHVNPMNTEKTAMHLEQITECNYIDEHRRVSEEMSDKAGRFEHASGEPHGRSQQQERTELKTIAADINLLIGEEEAESWYLAFPKEHRHELESMIDEAVKNRLAKSIDQDLTMTAKESVLSHFL